MMSGQSDFVSGTNINSPSTKVSNTKNLNLNISPYNHQSKPSFYNNLYQQQPQQQQSAFQQQQYNSYQNSISSYGKQAPTGSSYITNNTPNGYSNSTNGTSGYVNIRHSSNTPPTSLSNYRKTPTNIGSPQLQQVYPLAFTSPNQQYQQSPTSSIAQQPQPYLYSSSPSQKYDMGGSAQSKNNQQQQSQQQPPAPQPSQPSPPQSNTQQQYPYTSNSYNGAAYKTSSSSSSSMISNNYSNAQHQMNNGGNIGMHQYLNHIPPGVSQSRSPSLVKSIIELIRKLNIRLVAFDFDLTLVNTHTGGQWIDSPEKLAEFVRPCFRELLPVLLNCPDLFVCIVTYSPQEDLIRQVLKISLKEENGINELLDNMLIIGNTREFLETHGVENCYSMGKQIHLNQCKKHYESMLTGPFYGNSNAYQPKMNPRINDASILLIDDDVQNLRTAQQNGHLAFQVNNNMQLRDLYDFLSDQLRS